MRGLFDPAVAARWHQMVRPYVGRDGKEEWKQRARLSLSNSLSPLASFLPSFPPFHFYVPLTCHAAEAEWQWQRRYLRVFTPRAIF